jgi:hypothetical protein
MRSYYHPSLFPSITMPYNPSVYKLAVFFGNWYSQPDFINLLRTCRTTTIEYRAVRDELLAQLRNAAIANPVLDERFTPAQGRYLSNMHPTIEAEFSKFIQILTSPGSRRAVQNEKESLADLTPDMQKTWGALIPSLIRNVVDPQVYYDRARFDSPVEFNWQGDGQPPGQAPDN